MHLHYIRRDENRKSLHFSKNIFFSFDSVYLIAENETAKRRNVPENEKKQCAKSTLLLIFVGMGYLPIQFTKVETLSSSSSVRVRNRSHNLWYGLSLLSSGAKNSAGVISK